MNERSNDWNVAGCRKPQLNRKWIPVWLIRLGMNHLLNTGFFLLSPLSRVDRRKILREITYWSVLKESYTNSVAKQTLPSQGSRSEQIVLSNSWRGNSTPHTTTKYLHIIVVSISECVRAGYVTAPPPSQDCFWTFHEFLFSTSITPTFFTVLRLLLRVALPAHSTYLITTFCAPPTTPLRLVQYNFE